MTRCNPYGYATDAGPKHLMGGFYDARYAGKYTTLKSGIRGPAICENPPTIRARFICENPGHGSQDAPVMDLCMEHAIEIHNRMSQCCTRCVWPDQARGIDEACNWIMAQMAQARADSDAVRYRKLEDSLNDYARQMDELVARGVIAKVPMRLVEVS